MEGPAENENRGLKRIRDEMHKDRKQFPSETADAQKIRNQIKKQKHNQQRGRVEFYYKTDDEKTELFNKMDKIKLFMGEGQFNKVSSFSLLNRVFDHFITSNVPSESTTTDNTGDIANTCTYQYVKGEEALEEDYFVGATSSVQNMIDLVHGHTLKCPNNMTIVTSQKLRHVMRVEFKCDSGEHTESWTSSPHIANGKFLVNARMAHAFLSSGMLPNHFQKFCSAAQIGEMGDSYLNEYQQSYEQVVEEMVNASNDTILQEEIAMTAAMALNDNDILEGISILTDARHCWRKNAKFSDVVCIGNATHKVLKVETVTKLDETSSQKHELTGVKRIFEYFDDKSCVIKTHAHDQNNSVTKFVREERSPTETAIDTWHMTKGIAKKAKKITSGSRANNGKIWHEELSDKAASIKTHVYHSVKNCQQNAQKLQDNLLTIVSHYEGDHSKCFESSRCRQDPNYESSKFMIKDDKAKEMLTKFLKSLPVYKQAEHFRLCMDTHYVESFNNSLLQYHDKRIVFGIDSYKMRVNLAVLDLNAHVGRPYTSVKEVPYKRNPTKSLKVPVRKRKEYEFKDILWSKWLQKLYA